MTTGQIWGFTLVQHSAALRGDPCFTAAVELAHLHNQTEVDRVKKAGGVVYNSYKDATDAEYYENYPPEVGGLIARVRGTFSKYKLDGSKIYVPAK